MMKIAIIELQIQDGSLSLQRLIHEFIHSDSENKKA
jgi:hypothetical protein